VVTVADRRIERAPGSGTLLTSSTASEQGMFMGGWHADMSSSKQRCGRCCRCLVCDLRQVQRCDPPETFV